LKGPWVVAALLLSLAAPVSGAEAEKSKGPEPPKERDYSAIYDLFDNTLARPIARFADPPRWVRKIVRNPREAANVDEKDQVRLPSTWWQPRMGFRPVSIEQMLAGPGPGTGPAPGKWLVTKAKTQGVTPGFQIEDSKGDKFLIKFDPLLYSEMSSGSDVIGCHLFWAAGYNVPDNAIANFRREDLEIKKGSTYTDKLGKKLPITEEFLDELLTRVPRKRDKSYRALASRFLDGKPLGPFKYLGRRMDDPEDLVPHEHRRELRGLWAIAAWLNHADIRGPNSLDMWVKANDRAFVRHYLIDFGSLLGSSAIGPRALPTGTEYYVDFNVMARQMLTFGLLPFEWEGTVDPKMPSVGFVESKRFNPATWRPDYPNPAFDEKTVKDIRWGIRILSGFTDAHIRAAVERAQYSDPAATEYLIGVLIERRDKLVRYWLKSSAGKKGDQIQ
jgi:hypothetical protein